MSHLGESTFRYIMRKSGRKPTVCDCAKCQSQCHTPCLGTPEDIARLIERGYGDRLAPTTWAAGMVMGVTDRPVEMIQAVQREDGYCTFFHDGKCELHDLGLKPTEGRLSHHSLRIDNFNPKKSLSWLIAKEWIDISPRAVEALRLFMSDRVRKAVLEHGKVSLSIMNSEGAFVSVGEIKSMTMADEKSRTLDSVKVREKMMSEEIVVPKLNP